MKRTLVPVKVLYEFGDAALVVKLVCLLRLLALVLDVDANALVQKGLFAKALRELLKTVHRRLKNARVRTERDLGPAPSGRARLLERRDRYAGLELHLMRRAVTP